MDFDTKVNLECEQAKRPQFHRRQFRREVLQESARFEGSAWRRVEPTRLEAEPSSGFEPGMSLFGSDGVQSLTSNPFDPRNDRVFEDVLDHLSLNMRTVAWLRPVGQYWPELDMNFEISKSEHP